MAADKCNTVHRVSVHPSIKVGGASVGRCERDVLPGLVVCAEHADPEAIRILVEGYEKRHRRLIAEANEALEYAELTNERTAEELVRLAEHILKELK